MGNGYLIKCTKCNYMFKAMLGIGMMYPMVYNETVADIRDGKYGEEYKKFFEKHNNATVNCEAKVAVCAECGKLETVMDLSLYLPKDDEEMVYIYDDYMTPNQLKRNFKKCMTYNHQCSSCGGKMKNINLLSRLEKGTLKCPDCGEKLEMDEDSLFMLWD